VAGWLGYAPDFLHIGLASATAFLVIAAPRLKRVGQAILTPLHRHRWRLWLAWHIVAFGGFLVVTAAILDVETAAVRPSLLWPVAWLLSGATALLLWLGAVATPRVWRQFIQNEYAALLGARGLFRKSGASRTSCPPPIGVEGRLRRVSSSSGARLLDSRFRGNDARPQALAVYL
jgi:hypothetical protein